MNKSLIEFILKNRNAVVAITVLLTLFFGYHASKIKLITEFNDMLPQSHPYVKVHQEHSKNFGEANVILVAVTVKEGDIFNVDTLSKIKRITEAVDRIPGVNHYQVVSIAQRKVKEISASNWGLEIRPVMWPKVPETSADIDRLRENVYANDSIYGSLVSLDSKSALILANFFDEDIDYKLIFESLNTACESEEDSNTDIYRAGQPLLVGWIYHLLPQTYVIFGITLAVLAVLLFFYFGKIQGVVVPIISAAVSAVWGLGISALLGINFDPLILVIPFLISARVVSHSVQMVSRYLEEFQRLGDVSSSCQSAFEGLFKPGIVAILTDAVGIALIAFTPLPLMQKLALIGSFWLLTIILTVVILNPVLLSYFPRPDTSVKQTNEKIEYWEKALTGLAKIASNKYRYLVLIVVLIVVVIAGFHSRSLTVGDARPGSPILWQDSDYNIAVKEINKRFPGTDQLQIIVEGNEPNAIKSPEVLRTMESLQKYLEGSTKVGGTQSIVDAVQVVNMKMHEDDLKWDLIPKDKRSVGVLLYLYLSTAESGDLDRFVNYNFQTASITAFLKDHHGDTIRGVIERAKDFIAMQPMNGAKFKLAGGLIGILAAVNEEIERSHQRILFLVIFVVFSFCAIAFRSLTAGILLITGLVIANLLTFAFMAVNNIGLNINTLPALSLGIGLGVDYGIYILSRANEAYKVTGDLKSAITSSVTTAGRAVVFTATTLTSGVIFWYFLSDIRFQAEMGLLLAMLMIINMLGAIVLLPILITMTKPKFIFR